MTESSKYRIPINNSETSMFDSRTAMINLVMATLQRNIGSVIMQQWHLGRFADYKNSHDGGVEVWRIEIWKRARGGGVARHANKKVIDRQRRGRGRSCDQQTPRPTSDGHDGADERAERVERARREVDKKTNTSLTQQQ